MVTRKTRLLSAFAAVLMLVSMFTAFVLPATAAGDLAENPPVAWPEAWLEDSANIIAYKDRTASDTATDYAITDAEDWLALVLDCNGQKGPLNSSDRQTLEGYTFWFTNDIDFSGVTLSTTDPTKLFLGAYYKSSTDLGAFRGAINGQGYTVKNFDVDLTYTLTNGNYKGMGFVANTKNAVIRDLTIDSSCSFKYTVTLNEKNSDLFVGAFSGQDGGASVYINCRNEASVTAVDCADDTYSKVRLVTAFGRRANGGTFINCYNTGALSTEDATRISVFGDWLYPIDYLIYNSFNTGKLTSGYSGTYNYTGLIGASSQANVPDYVTASNIYAVGTPVAVGVNYVDEINAKGTSLEAGAEATGELAFLLNKNYDATYDEDYGHKYYTVEGDGTVWGTAANQTVKVALDFNGTEYVGYVNLDKSIDLDGLHEVEAVSYVVSADDADKVEISADNVLTFKEVPADLIVNITLTSDELYLDTLKEKVASFEESELPYYVSATYDGTLAELLASVNAKIAATEAGTAGAYTSNAEIGADIEAIESFSVNDILPITMITKYPDVSGYTVADAEELEFLSTVKATLTKDQTVYITGDIDLTDWTADTYAVEGNVNDLTNLKASLDGSKAESGKPTIKGLRVTGPSWLGTCGYKIANLIFDDCDITTLNASTSTVYAALLTHDTADALEISNVTMTNCDAAVDEASAGSVRLSLLTGAVDAGLTVRDVTIENCSVTTTAQNSSLLTCAVRAGDTTVERVYLNNNTFGAVILTTAPLLGEVRGNVLIKDTAVLNTKVAEGVETAFRGLLIGSHKNNGCTTTIENVITYNNAASVEECLLGDNAADMGVNNITVGNVYSEALIVLNHADQENNERSDESALIASGEAAYALNEAGVAQKWAMVNGTPVFDDATTNVPVKITFEAKDAVTDETTATYTLYTDTEGKLIGLEDILDAADWTDEDQLATKTFAANETITGKSIPAHEHELTYTDKGDGTHTAKCTFAQAGFTCDYEVTADHETEIKNVTDTNTTEPATGHEVIEECKYCTYETEPVSCVGTLSVDEEASSAANCTEAGVTVTVCSVCDYKHTKTEPALNHNWSDWAGIDGTNTHLRVCLRECGVEAETENCTVETWNVTNNPTVDAEGTREGICIKCQSTRTETVPALTGINLSAGTAKIGKTVEVAVELKNNPGIAGMELKVTYDVAKLTLVGAEKGSYDIVFPGSDTFPDNLTSEVNFNFLSEGDMEGDGTAIVLVFEVKDDEALVDTDAAVAVEVTKATSYDLEPVAVKGDDTALTIRSATIKGDLTDDTFVDIADAVLLLRYYNEKGDATEATIAGYYVNDEMANLYDDASETAPVVNTKDVIYLLQYLSGWYTDAEFFGTAQ